MKIQKARTKTRAEPGFEPGTSRTQSENHSQLDHTATFNGLLAQRSYKRLYQNVFEKELPPLHLSSPFRGNPLQINRHEFDLRANKSQIIYSASKTIKLTSNFLINLSINSNSTIKTKLTSNYFGTPFISSTR